MKRKGSDVESEPHVQSRITFVLPVLIEGDDANGVAFSEKALIENVTRRGAFVRTDQHLNPGNLLSINGADGDQERLCYAQVVWVRNEGAGESGLGVKLVGDNGKWMDHLILHSVKINDVEESEEES